MCFSATASFTAAAVLAAMGILTVQKSLNRKNLIFIAIIPCLFAFQQFAEGLVWLSLDGQTDTWWGAISKHIFLSFAFIVWPLWIPFAFWYAEPETSKWKNLLLFLYLLGLGWGFYQLSLFAKMQPVVDVIGSRLRYYDTLDPYRSFKPQDSLYFILVSVPMVLSSLHYAWIMSTLVLISGVVAAYFYYVSFGSVWCFFGALSSLVIYWIIKENVRKKT